MKKKKAWEAKLIGKILDFIDYLYPKIEEQARKEYIKKNQEKVKIIKTKIDFRIDFQAWFLLKYELPNGTTTMEMAGSYPLDYFNKKEKIMIKNFLNFKESMFQIINISKNKKNYTIKDIVDEKKYLVKTINLPAKFEEEGLIKVIIVKNIKGGYFFCGCIQSFEKESSKEIIKEIKKYKIKHSKKRNIKIEWEIKKGNKKNGNKRK